MPEVPTRHGERLDASPRVRRATGEDASVLAELGARTFRETFSADNRPEDMDAYLRASFGADKQATELAYPYSIFLIAEVDGPAIGYAHLRSSGTPPCVTGSAPVELVRIYVVREWLGRHAGALLMDACLAESRRAGHQTMWLGVWERNERAQRFYHKWGFAVVGDQMFQLGSDLQRDWIMARQID